MGITLIAAVAANHVIGKEGKMIWHLPEDMKRFRTITTGHPVLMGRKTYEGIIEQLGKPLPDRTSLVLSHSLNRGAMPKGVFVMSGIDSACAIAQGLGVEIYVIGGQSIYEQTIERADALMLTELHREYDGDARFPPVLPNIWREIKRESRDDYDFVDYQRRQKGIN